MSEPKKIPVLSLKGGTGKTTICLGLAEGLRDTGNKVGLLDVDIHASSLPRALHLEQDPGYDPILGGKLRPVNFDGYQLFSIGLLFKEEMPNMWDGETKASAVRQIATTAIAWDDDLEWVIVDTPPTSGDEVQSLLKHLPNIYGAIIVCQPNDLSILGIAKTLNVLREAETPIAGLVTNMAGYKCPHCGQISNPFDRPPEDVTTLAKTFGVRFLGAVPFANHPERQRAIKEILGNALGNRPVTLQKEKEGMSRWLLEKALKLAS
ncbi:Iron-sulfur cluster carrier protein [subsurface metagenome]